MITLDLENSVIAGWGRELVSHPNLTWPKVANPQPRPGYPSHNAKPTVSLFGAALRDVAQRPCVSGITFQPHSFGDSFRMEQSDTCQALGG